MYSLNAFFAIFHPSLALMFNYCRYKPTIAKLAKLQTSQYTQLTIIFPLCLVKCTPSSFQTKVVHFYEIFRLPFFISFIRSTCLAHIIFLDVIILLILSEMYSKKKKKCSSLLSILFQPIRHSFPFRTKSLSKHPVLKHL
jgi:hypothetical protein